MQRRFVQNRWVIALVEFALLASLYFVAAGAVNWARSAGMAMPVVAFGAGVLGWWVYRCSVQVLERRSAGELALEGAGREVLAGLTFGSALFSLCVVAVAGLGGLQVAGLRWPGNLAEMLAVAIISGFYEEAIFRGVILRHLETALGSLGALGLTALLFGAIHFINPDASFFAVLAISVEAGILLGAAYLVTRRLWLAIGIHAAWNFTQGWVFSIPVSGTGPVNGLLVTTREGPDWLTGGAFGLEASGVALLVATAAGLGLLHMAIRRGQIRPATRFVKETRQTKL